jgi:hypothetical protein
MHLRASAGDTEAKGGHLRNLSGRLAALEGHFGGGDVRLTMPDGSVSTVQARRLIHIFWKLGAGIVKEDGRAVIECVSDDCFLSGNGHMVELIKVAAFGAAQVEAELDSAEGTEETIQ